MIPDSWDREPAFLFGLFTTVSVATWLAMAVTVLDYLRLPTASNTILTVALGVLCIAMTLFALEMFMEMTT